jgi:hypothetical protein
MKHQPDSIGAWRGVVVRDLEMPDPPPIPEEAKAAPARDAARSENDPFEPRRHLTKRQAVEAWLNQLEAQEREARRPSHYETDWPVFPKHRR